MSSLMARFPRTEFDASRLWAWRHAPPQLVVHPSFAVGVFAVTCPFWLSFTLEGAALALTAFVVLLLSMLMHELAHAALARRYDIEFARIDIRAFGSTMQFGARPLRLSQDLALVYTGPTSNLALALASCLLLAPVLEPHMVKSGCETIQDGFQPLGFAGNIFAFAMFANLALAIVNLLPVRPLDGGWITWRALRQRAGRLRADLVAAAHATALGMSSLLMLLAFLIVALPA
jgi:Zn-dependent protease